MAIFVTGMRAHPEADLSPILRNVGKHISLDAGEIAHFSSLLRAVDLRKGDFLFSAGEVVSSLAYVLQGCLRSYSIDDKGNEHVLQFAPEDWWTGDLGSFTKGTAAITHCDALEDSIVVRMERSDVEHLYERVPKFERFFRILITNAFIAAQKRLLSTISQPAEERYREFMKLYPELEGRVPQKHIASYLGMTPEFLSTVRKRVREKVNGVAGQRTEALRSRSLIARPSPCSGKTSARIRSTLLASSRRRAAKRFRAASCRSPAGESTSLTAAP
jgi:CRP-like cAMP-binding protein